MLALDSNVFIYILDKHPVFFDAARAVLDEAANETIVISTLVYTESLAKLSGRVFTEARQALDALCQRGRMQIVAIDVDLAVAAARLRSRYQLKTPDAIHIATALQCGASALITNDLSLTKLTLDGLAIRGL